MLYKIYHNYITVIILKVNANVVSSYKQLKINLNSLKIVLCILNNNIRSGEKNQRENNNFCLNIQFYQKFIFKCL